MVNYEDLAKAGTLSEFDMVLGITQDAVNNGLGVLFEDPLDPTDPDGKTVIDHTMILGGFRQVFTLKSGKKIEIVSNKIFAEEIEQPYVDFNNAEQGRPFRSVRIYFPIKRGAIQYTIQGEEDEQRLDGYRLSWTVNLRKRNIVDIHNAVMHPEAVSAINGVTNGSFERGDLSSEHFTVAALFCLFEAATIGNTFLLERPDPADNSPEGTPASQRRYIPLDATDTLSHEVQLTLTTHYGDKYKEETNPFILGYGVSQNVGPSRDSVFKPVDFQFSTTPASNQSQPGTAMLNFCMITPSTEPFDQREGRISVERNQNAGVLDSTLGARTKATPDTSGVMAFSRNLIESAIIRERIIKQKPGIWVDPPRRVGGESSGDASTILIQELLFTNPSVVAMLAKAIESLFTLDKRKAMAAKLQKFMNECGRDPIIRSDNYSTEGSTKTIREAKFDYPDHLLISGTFSALEVIESGGSHRLEVSYDSTLSANPGMSFEKDTARKVTIHFTGTVKNWYRSYMVLPADVVNRISGAGDPAAFFRDLKPKKKNGDTDPEGEWRTEITYSGKIVLGAGSDSGGSGSWRVIDAESSVDSPLDASGNLKQDRMKKSRDLFSGRTKFLTWIEEEVFQGEDKHWSVFRDLNTSVFKDGLKLSMDGINGQVVMPAGEVFDFRGLDSDNKGHFYSHVTYKLVDGGSRTWSDLPITDVAFNTALNRMYKADVLAHSLKLAGFDISNLDLPFVVVKRDSGEAATLITVHLPFNNGVAAADGATVSVDGYRLSWTAKLPRNEIQNIVDSLTHATISTWEEHKDYALATTARLLNLVQTPSFVQSATVLLERPDPENVSKEKIVSRLRAYLPVVEADGVAYHATRSFADTLQSGGLSGPLLGYEVPANGISA